MIFLHTPTPPVLVTRSNLTQGQISCLLCQGSGPRAQTTRSRTMATRAEPTAALVQFPRTSCIQAHMVVAHMQSVMLRVGFVVCREPGRISLYVALPPSRPQPIGSRKQLEPRSRSAVHRDENFVS